MKTFGAILLLSLGAESARAAAGGGVPTTEIFWQLVNLGLLLGGLIYFLRQPVKDFFRDRQAQFLDAANKAQTAKLEAEKQLLDIKHRLEHLESNRQDDIARAEAEAADLRKQMIREGEELAVRIRHEAEVTAGIETQRARLELHQQFVQEAVAAARTVLTKDVSGQDHQKLQSEFMSNIQAVNP